jgi:hypothetical protein
VLETHAEHEGMFVSADAMATGRRLSHTDMLRLLYLLGAAAGGWAIEDYAGRGWPGPTRAGLAIVSLVIVLPLMHTIWHVYQEEKKYRKAKRAWIGS